jgi:Zn ribbon nucleic-acid-binding protein
MACVECGHERVNTRYWVEDMPYGDNFAVGTKQQTIRVVIPVRECLFCGANWTDGDADIARARAIERHNWKGIKF